MGTATRAHAGQREGAAEGGLHEAESGVELGRPPWVGVHGGRSTEPAEAGAYREGQPVEGVVVPWERAASIAATTTLTGSAVREGALGLVPRAPASSVHARRHRLHAGSRFGLMTREHTLPALAALKPSACLAPARVLTGQLECR